MSEELAGTIKSSQFQPPNPKGLAVGIIIRPEGDDWLASFVVGNMARLVFPNGEEYLAKIIGGEICTPPPRGILLEPLPQFDNQIPPGTKVYVEKWRPKNVSEVLAENPTE